MQSDHCCYSTIAHGRKKTSNDRFDVTMGSYDGAETCKLVGCYLFRLATSRPHDNPRRKCFGERIVFFRTRSGWASDEVAKGRLLSLARFSFASRAKKGMTQFASSELNGAIRREQSNMFVPTKSKEEICWLFAEGIRNKDEIKWKLISISSRRLERRSPVVFFGPTLVPWFVLIETKD